MIMVKMNPENMSLVFICELLNSKKFKSGNYVKSNLQFFTSLMPFQKLGFWETRGNPDPRLMLTLCKLMINSELIMI